MIKLDPEAIRKRKSARAAKNRFFSVLCWSSASVSIVVLAVLLLSIALSGSTYLLTSQLGVNELSSVDWSDVAAAADAPGIASLDQVDWPALIESQGLTTASALDRIDWESVRGADAATIGALSPTAWRQVTAELRTFDLGAIGRFISSSPSRSPELAGLGPAMAGSILICAICAIVALPLGVGTAIFLEEYKPQSARLRKAHGFVQLNISNLAGVPSIVYGILGLTVFVQMFNLLGNANDPSFTLGLESFDQVTDEAGNYFLFPVDGRNEPPVTLTDGMMAESDLGESIRLHVVSSEEMNAKWDQLDARIAALPGDLSNEEFEAKQTAIKKELFIGVIPADDPFIQRVGQKKWWYVQLPFGRGVLAGGLTLMLVILPVVIVSSQEAIRSVPPSLREGAFGLGSTKWQAIRRIVLPSAVPGIMTGAILAISRAIGEAAPILILAGIVYITFLPSNVMDDFTAMPLQIYDWAGRPQAEFHHVAASGIIVLLAVLLSFNGVAVFVRQRFQKPLQ